LYRPEAGDLGSAKGGAPFPLSHKNGSLLVTKKAYQALERTPSCSRGCPGQNEVYYLRKENREIIKAKRNHLQRAALKGPRGRREETLAGGVLGVVSSTRALPLRKRGV